MSLKLAFALILSVQVQASIAFAQPSFGGARGDHAGAPGPRGGGGGGGYNNPGPQGGGYQSHDDGGDQAADDAAAAAGAAEAGVLIIGLLYDLYQQHEADQAEQQQTNQEEQAAEARALHKKYDNDLCSEIYTGKFKTGDQVSVDLGAGAKKVLLNDLKSGASYPATGSCTVSQDRLSATIKFTLDDDARYSFTGKATRQSGNGKGFDFGLTLSELKSGKAIDGILAAR